jgi:hypothetical protein
LPSIDKAAALKETDFAIGNDYTLIRLYELIRKENKT